MIYYFILIRKKKKSMSETPKSNPIIKYPYVILIVVCILAICGIVYELLISTAASYLLGDSVTQFSVIIGIYMSSMGLGAYLSKYIETKLLEKFIQVEIALSVVGGASIILIFMFYSSGSKLYFVILYGLTILIGSLVGFEIPLVMRIMETILKLKDNVANVLAFDYIGGLIGSVAFPLLFLPTLGIMKTSILIGVLNLISALWLLIKTEKFKFKNRYYIITITLIGILSTCFVYSKPLNDYLEQNFYKDKILVALQTPYQKVVITKYKSDVRLFIDGNLQFSSIDEYRYHESLIHIPASLIPNIENVLILGGGDGLAARELLKYKTIKKIVIVDLDNKLVQLFKKEKLLTALNADSLNNKKVKVVAKDAMEFIKDDPNIYELIVVDLPDPRTPALCKLYNKQFYYLVQKRLSRTGTMVTQATSPFFAKKAFWCIYKTVKESFPYANRYHANVLSFGDWGFVMGSNLPINKERIKKINISVPTRYLTNDLARAAFLFGKDDTSPENIKVNTMFDPVLVQYYLKSWENWY